VNTTIGYTAVLVGFVASLMGAGTIAYALRSAARESAPQLSMPYMRLGRRYAWVTLAMAVLIFVVMERALITRDFTSAYVAQVGSSKTRPFFNFASLWSSLEGSIILWTLILCGYVAVIARKFRNRISDPMFAWALLVMFVVTAFFFFLMVGPTNPFRTFDPPPGFDGPGPNPILQNHVLQVLAFLAMEPPRSLEAGRERPQSTRPGAMRPPLHRDGTATSRVAPA